MNILEETDFDSISSNIWYVDGGCCDKNNTIILICTLFIAETGVTVIYNKNIQNFNIIIYDVVRK